MHWVSELLILPDFFEEILGIILIQNHHVVEA
jgi:hypothetical protein